MLNLFSRMKKSIFLKGENLQSVLFKTAINSAKSGLRVWYISVLPFENIPNDIEIPEKEVLNLITFIYLKDYQCLISHLNGVHLWRETPRVLLIDRYDLYSCINEENYDPICGALIATTILNASNSILKKCNENIHLIITGNIKTIADRRFNVLKNLYFSKVFTYSTTPETLKVINEFIS